MLLPSNLEATAGTYDVQYKTALENYVNGNFSLDVPSTVCDNTPIASERYVRIV